MLINKLLKEKTMYKMLITKKLMYVSHNLNYKSASAGENGFKQ